VALRKKKSEEQPSTPSAPKRRWWTQMREAYRLTKGYKRSIGWILLAIVVSVTALGVGIGMAIGRPIYAAFITLPFALLITTIVFSRTAERAAYSSIEGQPGAAASVMMAIRKGFTTTPAVAVNKNQDMVHRALGRPGVILVAEGGYAVRGLITDERRRMERFVPGVPVTIVVVGDGEDQVPIAKLQKHMRKLPKTISPAQVREVRNRLKAVGGMNLPLPKGPMPKNLRVPRPR
jgi:hypothetical protein